MTIDAINLPRRLRFVTGTDALKRSAAPKQGLVMSYEVRAFSQLIAGRLRGVVRSTRMRNSLAVMNVLDEARRQQGLVFPADLNR